MALYNFHRILIVAAIFFDIAFSFWCWGVYRQTGEGIYLFMLVGTTVITLALIAYLIYFHRKTERLRHAVAGVCLHCKVDIASALLAGATQCPRCGKEIDEQMRRIAQANL